LSNIAKTAILVCTGFSLDIDTEECARSVMVVTDEKENDPSLNHQWTQKRCDIAQGRPVPCEVGFSA
jgi:hypothetical protein